MRVEWTDRAKKDLRKLFDYYKDDAQNVVAKSVTNHIVRQSMLLESLPLLGLVEPSLEGYQVQNVLIHKHDLPKLFIVWHF